MDMQQHEDRDLQRAFALWQVVQAVEQHVGRQFTLLRFATGWKAMAGTPDLRSGQGYEEVWNLPAFETPTDALRWAAYSVTGRPIEHYILGRAGSRVRKEPQS